jgi:hypothetical protein
MPDADVLWLFCFSVLGEPAMCRRSRPTFVAFVCLTFLVGLSQLARANDTDDLDAAAKGGDARLAKGSYADSAKQYERAVEMSEKVHGPEDSCHRSVARQLGQRLPERRHPRPQSIRQPRIIV